MLKYLVFMMMSLLCLSGCKTAVIGLNIDPLFTVAQVNSAQFAVGGVVSEVNDLSKKERSKLESQMLRSFQTEIEKMHISSLGAVNKVVKNADYKAMLQQYKRFNSLDPAILKALYREESSMNYLIFCRIESNVVSQEKTEEKTKIAESKALADKGIFNSVRVDISFITKRKIGASLIIYDLAMQRSVWSGFVYTSDRNSNDSSQTYETNKDVSLESVGTDVLQGIFNGMVNMAMGEEDPALGYPNPPSTIDVFASVIEGFAENMPAKDPWYQIF